MFTVTLAARGNPDYGQNPARPLPGLPDTTATVATLKEAGKACRAWIDANDIGSGNWAGGIVKDAASRKVAEVSYNGRVWEA